jgi:dihydroxyacetone kinase-like protein
VHLFIRLVGQTTKNDRLSYGGVYSLQGMKKLINEPQDVVRESLEGLALAHADMIRVSFDPVYVVRREAPVRGKVGVISGGGSGHEPMHGGYVGRGMLDAAVPGQVFTSPTPDQIEAATRAVDGGAGVLHIVKNYTGDILNFEMAAELCQMDVQAVVIHDDVAVEDSLYTAGRRGVGATVLAEKICGAAAERGYDLNRVAALCRKVNENARSMGMALTSCTVPAAGKPTFELAANEMEMGIGIHGEPGRERLPLQPVREIVMRLTETVVADLGLSSGHSVIAMVNGMGGTPLIELYVAYRELEQVLKAHGIGIVRRLVGNYITSLEMAGCSVTLLLADEELVSLWDDPVVTPGLRWGA